MGYIKSGQEDGAAVHISGERQGNDGYFVQLTIFRECKPNMKIVQKEIFGPVAAVIKFTTEEEAFEHALHQRQTGRFESRVVSLLTI
ncbi:aldehyde dehydrogenase family-domain-containing protein [Suillus subluteus]|nr:aldehyde dehydrogenase family-domain-containing protein [Suillus subluteus]